jgi:hypothetical protein
LGTGPNLRGDFVQSVQDRLQAALCVHVESVADRLGVLERTFSSASDAALQRLADHDDRQQNQLEERQRNPRDDRWPARLDRIRQADEGDERK